MAVRSVHVAAPLTRLRGRALLACCMCLGALGSAGCPLAAPGASSGVAPSGSAGAPRAGVEAPAPAPAPAPTAAQPSGPAPAPREPAIAPPPTPVAPVAEVPLAPPPAQPEPARPANPLGNPLAAAPNNPLAKPPAPDPWVATWEGEGLRLELRAANGAYAGEIALGGDRFPLTVASRGEARLEGSFSAQGHAFPCALTRTGPDALALATADTTYALRRATPPAPANPLAATATPNPLAGTPPAPAGAAGAAPAIPGDWQTFTHPLGMSMRYPAGWQLRELPGCLGLVPPDLLMEYGQPAEALLVAGSANAGVTRVEDERVAQTCDALVMQLLPFLRREGPVQPLPGAQPTGLLRYSGRNPQGKAIQARLWVVLFPEAALSVFLAGEGPQVAKREPLLRLVAGSFAKGEAQRDARLAGAWRYESHYFSGPGGGNFSSTSIRVLTLRADGAAWSGGRLLATSELKDGQGDVTARGHVDSGDPDQKRGQWSAGSGRLFLQWPDGGEEYRYELSGNSLLLTPEGGKPKLYERVQ